MTSALGMRVKLDRLRRDHGHHQPQPVTVPLSAPTERPQILSGFAATTTVDLVRNKFRGFCFGTLRFRDVPLFFKHNPEREVGTITDLQYDSAGNLIITARVTCPLARRANAFSIGATVRSFEIVDAARATYHALITEAVIDEISLTDVPANPAAIVTSRRDTSAQAEFYDHAIQHIEVLKKLATLAAGRIPA